MWLIALSIFSAAFLVFQIQPIIGKYILPWFGGGPAVWTTTVLFFQLFLFLGYLYAHLSATRLSVRQQLTIHLALIAGAAALLPVIPADTWKPADPAMPTIRIVLLLTATLGIPYLTLAATSPLLQAWSYRLQSQGAPYRLFALSNFASLAALITYPFVVEPLLSRPHQALIWSIGYVVFGAATLGAAVVLWRTSGKGALGGSTIAEAATSPEPKPLHRIMWLLLPATASTLMLAVTNELTQDVAPVPFLWVLPLSLYLLSFIIVFAKDTWYPRRFVLASTVPALAGTIWMLFADAGIMWQVGIYSASLLVFCTGCHGELARLKPAPDRLTRFYLTVAGGGALGGLFVAVIAPVVFDRVLELHVGLLACAALLSITLFAGTARRKRVEVWAAAVAIGIVLPIALGIDVFHTDEAIVERTRTFYGSLTLRRTWPGTQGAMLVLRNGGIDHGLQFVQPGLSGQPTMYYTPRSGVGIALRALRSDAGRRVGIVGLGVGTLAAYGRDGDYFRFYELDPEVIKMARGSFSFLARSVASVDVIPGDARLSMEREPDQLFDMLVLDAFSGDAIPVHLLTREAFDLYRRHLRPDGVLAIHISNQHLDLRPVVEAGAEQLGMQSVFVRNEWRVTNPDVVANSRLSWRAEWMVVTNNRAVMSADLIQRAREVDEVVDHTVTVWTDDYSNLFSVLRRAH